MKYIKTYELINQDKPKVGDYVICCEEGYKTANLHDKIFYEFINENIGQLVKIDPAADKEFPYIVKYNNINWEVGKYFRNTEVENARKFDRSEIKNWSEDKEELEVFLSAKKYNL